MDKVCADVVLLHGCPQSCMPNLSKALLKSMKTRWRSCCCCRYFLHRMRRLKICSVFSFLLWSLPVLQQWSSQLVASICSIWSSAWLYLVNWWGLLFGCSSTDAGCLSWEVWWLRTGSTGLAILLSAKSCCRLSWEWWLHPLLGPVLLRFCWLQLTSLSSMIVLQPPILCEGWVGHPLCLSGYSSVLMDLLWPCGCTAKSSILSIGSVSVALLWGLFLNDLGQ